MQQVVSNLLSNAVKFTPEGGQVLVLLQRSDHRAKVIVSDTGRGIRPEFLPHVFERFRQADGSTTRQHGGLGLGLAIVKHLIELHGGNVTATSEGEGRGATFTVELPLTAPVVSRLPTPIHRLRSVQDVQLDGLKVLLVEDDRDAAEVVRTILEAGAARTWHRRDAMRGLELLRESQFDVLVSDIGMPEMDGYGLIRRACANLRPHPIVTPRQSR